MPKIIIHRGSYTIGGTCVEVSSKGHRIILDLGMPLMKNDGSEIEKEKIKNPSIKNEILPDVDGLYVNQQSTVDAVIISHAHLDHCGLLNHLNLSIPVYLSKGSHALIKIGKIFYPAPNKIYFNNFEIFEHWKPFNIGPFKITSYLMDHSAYDSSSMLIETENKKIFYSGDFRGHGRKAKLLNNLIKKPIKNINCLIMEGTTLGGDHDVGFNNEEEIETEMHNIFSSQKDVSFIMASGSNIDRLVSIYRAAKRSNKTLVLDLYTFYVLKQLKKITPSLPPHLKDNIRIYYIKNHAQTIVENLGKDILYQYKTRKIEMDEIINYRKDMVLKLPLSAMERIAKNLCKEKILDEANFIFSMWSGYLNKDNKFYDFYNKYQLIFRNVHTSGHAYLKDLKSLANALKPKVLIPVHTLFEDDFDKHFDNVIHIGDCAPFEIN